MHGAALLPELEHAAVTPVLPQAVERAVLHHPFVLIGLVQGLDVHVVDEGPHVEPADGPAGDADEGDAQPGGLPATSGSSSLAACPESTTSSYTSPASQMPALIAATSLSSLSSEATFAAAPGLGLPSLVFSLAICFSFLFSAFCLF